MSVSLAKHLVDELLTFNSPSKPTRLIWHGGEPMLAGINFYDEICQYIVDHYPQHNVEHYIQTNGLLLNEEWVDFFLARDFKVGVSMDGDQPIHDACRKDINGRGSFEKVFHNVKNARQRGLIVGFLSVITQYSLGHEEEIFRFFYENRFDFAFHPITSLTPEMDKNLAITPQEFADVTIKLFNLGFTQPYPKVTNVSPTMHYAMAVIMGCPSGFCVMAKSCAEEYISVEPDGQVQVCDRFSGNSELSFGNISTSPLSEILKSPIRQDMLERWERVKEKCGNCEWANICFAGCLHEAYTHSGTIFSKDPNCQAYKQIFSHIFFAIRNELDKAERV